MVDKLAPDELKACKEAFAMFDKNHDGTISTKELYAAMRRAGQNPREEDVQNLINEYDVDGSGYLELREFCDLMYKEMAKGDQEQHLQEVFRVFAKDETGCITAEELKFVLTHVPDERVTYKEIDEMIKTVDENGDGKINYQEFRVMIGAQPNLTASVTEQNPILAQMRNNRNKQMDEDERATSSNQRPSPKNQNRTNRPNFNEPRPQSREYYAYHSPYHHGAQNYGRNTFERFEFDHV
ncbi:neo-calmodulin-like [Tigriopus californicus]|uniref:neo-calmodulin-like n=1 Tax=Tigriopus californicus TaxID=6832 RepID=UPI0027DAA992|nr:neo-calmodulin-like [Tigriopus californicus]XP_059090226.1 neo-calmodulin-like [Tigriopus californicus]XP_059090227.1 neo-calmodulin-like [Tigriopus californicus]